MPVVTVERQALFKAIGESFTDEQFDALCFDYGIELDEITTAQDMALREKVGKSAAAQELANADHEVVYKIEIPANRYDMLCLEGLARALRIFRSKTALPVHPVEYKLTTTKPTWRLTIAANTAPLRPHCVAAILRNVTLDEARYESFIELQDKLHHTLCRKRTLVAIGTHDLSTVQGPELRYETRAPKDIYFKPLNTDREMTGEELMTHYEQHNKLKRFLPIIRDAPAYPLVLDAKGTILSLPPIINSEHSKIKISTRDILIECTATDRTKADTVLATVCAMFSEYSKEPFTMEPVEIVYEAHPEWNRVTPCVETRHLEISLAYIKRVIGVSQLSLDECVNYLRRMSLGAAVATGKEDLIDVFVPMTRSDILHACDVAEDVAISYGFNRIAKTRPGCYTVARALPINALTDQVRRELALCGWSEALTLTLCSRDENGVMLRVPENNQLAVHLANPKTAEYQVVRTSLLPGLLKTVASNSHAALPLTLFEVADVCLLDASRDTGARNERRMGAIWAGQKSEFEQVQGVLGRVLAMLGCHRGLREQDYKLVESKVETYFEGWRADIVYKGQLIGHVGVVHPEVSKAFDISFVCTAMECNIEPFL